MKSHLMSLVKVGEFILNNGPVVKTQEVGKMYLNEKGLAKRKRSMKLYKTLAKHLNLVQIYMYHTAYLTENSYNLSAVFHSISNILMSKETVENRLKPSFVPALKYLDSHRDRQVVKALMAELTNTSFAARLQGLQSRSKRDFKSKGSRYLSPTVI